MVVDNSRSRNGDFLTINLVALDEVTTATDGDKVDMSKYIYKSIFANISSNAGAVTINIEASNDGTTWTNLNSSTYTSSSGSYIKDYTAHYPFMRVTTTNQTSAEVTVSLTGKN